MSEDRKTRLEDFGFGRLLKFLPYIALVFTAGALCQAVKTNAALTDKLNGNVEVLDTRITRVEDAVIYLKEIVKEDRRGHGG